MAIFDLPGIINTSLHLRLLLQISRQNLRSLEFIPQETRKWEAKGAFWKVPVNERMNEGIYLYNRIVIPEEEFLLSYVTDRNTVP
jgi:hypothetical protein